VSEVYAQMDEIDGNADLSREDKQYRRSEVMAQTLAEFEASKTLVRAREAVRFDASPAMLKALEQAEAGWKKAMDKIDERAGRTKDPIRGDKSFSTCQRRTGCGQEAKAAVGAVDFAKTLGYALLQCSPSQDFRISRRHHPMLNPTGGPLRPRVLIVDDELAKLDTALGRAVENSCTSPRKQRASRQGS
jgi:hypothetical protein